MKDMHLPKPDPAPDFTLFIEDIVVRSHCDRHGVPKTVPCYILHSGVNPEHSHIGICNGRARSAGFSGKISQEALYRRSKFKKK